MRSDGSCSEGLPPAALRSGDYSQDPSAPPRRPARPKLALFFGRIAQVKVRLGGGERIAAAFKVAKVK
ncbi:hypothetical protein ACP4OV_007347 [Aristida adscensionis]